MTEVKNSMTFYMIYGMKETYTEARREDVTGQTLHDLSQFKQNVMTKLNLVLFLYWTYPYPCLDVQDNLSKRMCHNFHDFYEFSKTWSQIP